MRNKPSAPKGSMIPEQCAIDVVADNSAHTAHIMLSVILVLCVMLVAAIGVILHQHKTFAEALQQAHEQYIELLESIETTETYKLEVDQDADNNSDNYFVGRDLYGWQTEGNSHSDENQDP